MSGGSLALALALGMVATVNPCGFAMLPAYLSYFLGIDGAGSGDVTSRSAAARVDGPGKSAAAFAVSVAQAVRVALAVSVGFLAVFALAGTLVRQTSVPIYDNAPWISIVIGLALLVLGVAMLFGFELVTRLPRLDRGGRARTVPSMFVFGVSYAIASLGCTLPLFLSTVAGAIERESLADGLVTFGAYALGMTLVLTALTVAIALARTSLLRLLRRTQPYVGRVAGGLVALAGAYVALYGWLEVRTLRTTGEIPESGITDTVTNWSYDVSEWITDVGAVRIAVVVGLALAALAFALSLRARPRPRPSGDPDADPAGAPGSSAGDGHSLGLDPPAPVIDVPGGTRPEAPASSSPP
ncbi:MAG TPA: cytochrome c biogenesis protein CcdA [Acidimicrobiales bacterium]|nr:cytochrome c biogenesis protein CcdA [Acidimicrobiales bacterium]